MPSVILHTMFGEDVISSLRAEIQAEIISSDCRPSFVLGCQGPDIFYHSQRHRPVALEYGSLLHRRGYGVFSACLLKTGLSLAYALGFITHAFLDRACHPYIIYFSGKDYHSFFERIIDTLMLKRLRGLEPALWDQERLLAAVCEQPPPGLKETIARCLADAFGERVTKDRHLARRIDNAFIDCARFYSMSSPSKIKETPPPAFTMRSLNYIYPDNLPAQIDFLNLDHKPWRYPHIPANGQLPREDTRSFLDIYAEAVKTAVNAIAPFLKPYIETGVFQTAAAAEAIGNQSLSIHDENRKPCSPNLTAPLPLDEVIKQQAKLRGLTT